MDISRLGVTGTLFDQVGIAAKKYPKNDEKRIKNIIDCCMEPATPFQVFFKFFYFVVSVILNTFFFL